MTGDISPNFRPCKKDRQTIAKILPYGETPQAITGFARLAWRLTDYAYWFILSTLWVGYAIKADGNGHWFDSLVGMDRRDFPACPAY